MARHVNNRSISPEMAFHSTQSNACQYGDTTQGEIVIDDALNHDKGIAGSEVMDQEKLCYNSLEKRFQSKEQFLSFLEFKREIKGGIGQAKLQNYHRKKDKCSREYFMESRKGSSSLFHPLTKKIYIFGGLGRHPISFIEEF